MPETGFLCYKKRICCTFFVYARLNWMVLGIAMHGRISCAACGWFGKPSEKGRAWWITAPFFQSTNQIRMNELFTDVNHFAGELCGVVPFLGTAENS